MKLRQACDLCKRLQFDGLFVARLDVVDRQRYAPVDLLARSGSHTWNGFDPARDLSMREQQPLHQIAQLLIEPRSVFVASECAMAKVFPDRRYEPIVRTESLAELEAGSVKLPLEQTIRRHHERRQNLLCQARTKEYPEAFDIRLGANQACMHTPGIQQQEVVL